MAILTSMARGRLRLSLRPSPRPRLILTSCTDMDSDTMVDTSDTMADSDTTARGLLMLRPILTFFMEDTLDTDTLDTPDTSDTMAMDSDTTDTARGLLMLRPIPTFFIEDTLDTPDTSDTMVDSDTMDTDTADTSTANRLHQDISVNHRLNLGQKWIIISLKFPSPVLQFQCYHN